MLDINDARSIFDGAGEVKIDPEMVQFAKRPQRNRSVQRQFMQPSQGARTRRQEVRHPMALLRAWVYVLHPSWLWPPILIASVAALRAQLGLLNLRKIEMTSHDILPTMNTISADTETRYRMNADSARRRLNEIVADMKAQTPVSELLSKYGLEMLCARTCLEIEPAILLGNTTLVRELRQQVTDELSAAFPYSDALIGSFARDLMYFYGSLAGPRE